MDGIAVAIIAAVLAYFFGYQQMQRQRLYEQRVAVIAELNRLMWRFQQTALSGTNPGQPIQVRDPWIVQNKRVFTELQEFYFANTVWLDERIHGIIQPFFMGMMYTLRTWEADLDEQGNPSSQAGLAAAQRIHDAVPLVRHELEPAFRAILYPILSVERLLQIWERIEHRNRRQE
jgi:hypothetical protein